MVMVERELPRPEYPRPRLRRREWVNLNCEWEFGAGTEPRFDRVETYRAQVEALLDSGPVEGFCYTQLTDVEQELTGLLTSDRRPKAEPARLREVTRTTRLRRPGESR